MRRHFIGTVTVLLLATAWTHDKKALAQEIPGQVPTGFALNRFEPTEHSDWFTTESLDFRGNRRLALGVIQDYQYRPLAIYDDTDSVTSSLVLHQLTLHLGASMSFFDRIRIGASLPIALFTEGSDGVLAGTLYSAPAKRTALGDLRISLDGRLVGAAGERFQLAVGGQLWLPTGSADSYTSDGEFRLAPRIMVAGDAGMFAYSARAGFDYRSRTEQFGGTSTDSNVFLGAAAGVRLLDKQLLVGPELFASTVTDAAFSETGTPVEIVFGCHYKRGDFRVGAGVGRGLSRGYGAPAFRGLLSFDWMPAASDDTDGDGLADSSDACPSVRGDRTTDPRTNGCPRDGDGDRVPDTEDACPGEAGQRSDDPAENGCPDKDGDGIGDRVDACVDAPGPKTNVPATHGCPPKERAQPTDRDKDGLPDTDDACPDQSGARTDDPKTSGCPDPDRDKDGIPNETDACPDEPGKSNGSADKNGCPIAFVKDAEIKITEQVRFQTNSARILPGFESEEVLLAILEILEKHPEITSVRVEGHSDDRGSATRNLRLSAARAASVVKWLTSRGIDSARLSSQGFGEERPIADNTTPEGRRANRRVEFHIGDRAGPAAEAP